MQYLHPVLALRAETSALMQLLGLKELPDATDLLVGLGRVHVSPHLAREASSARLSKPSPRKRLLADGHAADAAVPIRRPRRVPGGDPLDVGALLAVAFTPGLMHRVLFRSWESIGRCCSMCAMGVCCCA